MQMPKPKKTPWTTPASCAESTGTSSPWAHLNLSVSTNVLISAAFSVGNIIGPQLFKPKDAPRFIPAKIIALVTALVVACIAAALRIYYGWQNKIRDATEQRAREAGELKDVANIEWLDCTWCTIGVRPKMRDPPLGQDRS
ncbi:hypothetical protein B0H15DRAFT_806205 [Mycena belliarum]|uniref:Uncharacterized protein n=1 Tax=Mycena belliarum TaxID=1033014 RepID=A0AAD6TQC8_9AGAR|nr:hypothetical protein B0H15DRAFT_806205 [Mycena belliae]